MTTSLSGAVPGALKRSNEKLPTFRVRPWQGPLALRQVDAGSAAAIAAASRRSCAAVRMAANARKECVNCRSEAALVDLGHLKNRKEVRIE